MRIKRWKIEKNVKTSEAQAMVTIQQRRKDLEGKSTIFTIRNRVVPPEKIERFARRQNHSATMSGKKGGRLGNVSARIH